MKIIVEAQWIIDNEIFLEMMELSGYNELIESFKEISKKIKLSQQKIANTNLTGAGAESADARSSSQKLDLSLQLRKSIIKNVKINENKPPVIIHKLKDQFKNIILEQRENQVKYN